MTEGEPLSAVICMHQLLRFCCKSPALGFKQYTISKISTLYVFFNRFSSNYMKGKDGGLGNEICLSVLLIAGK